MVLDWLIVRVRTGFSGLEKAIRVTVTGSGAMIGGVNDGRGLRPVIRTGDLK